MNFGKIPNGLWPPLIFGSLYCNFSANPRLKPCIKVQNLQYKCLQWKCPPPFWNFSENSSVLVLPPVPYEDKQPSDFQPFCNKIRRPLKECFIFFSTLFLRPILTFHDIFYCLELKETTRFTTNNFLLTRVWKCDKMASTSMWIRTGCFLSTIL